MSPKSTIIKKVRIKRRKTFEERSWPVHLSVACFAAVATGSVILFGVRFGNISRPLMVSLLTGIAVSYGFVAMFLDRWLRRTDRHRATFAFILSLICNLLAAVVLSYIYFGTTETVVNQIAPVEAEKKTERIIEVDLIYEEGEDRPRRAPPSLD